MTLLTFIGRALFAFLFIFTDWQEVWDYRVDVQLPEDIKLAVDIAMIGCKTAGGVLFICGKTSGVIILLGRCIVTLIYNYGVDKREFAMYLGLLGALLFFIDMKILGQEMTVKKTPIKKKRRVRKTKTG